MANVQVLYGESVSATTANSTTWVDVASISSGSFTANKKYLILANQVTKIASASEELRVRLVRGATPTVFDDASLAYEGVNAAMEHELSYMFMYTQPATPETIKLQISVSGTATATNILSQIIAINMDDVGSDCTDYFWNEDLTNYTMTSTPTAKAITSSFTPNGTDKWLFIGSMIYDVVTIVDQIGFELYDSVAGVLNKGWVEGEDATNDFKGFNLFWVGVPTNAARTLAVRPVNEAGSNVMLASRVIAINLAKFAQSSYVFDATEVNPASSPSWTNIATIAPTPTNTGDWVVIAFLTSDINESTGDIETRLQINPAGGGLVDNPAYTNTAPGNDAQDPLDETPFTVFKLLSLSSGGARTINYDVRRTAGTTGRIEDVGLVAFSVEKASSGSAFTRSVADTTGITDALTKKVTFIRAIATTEAITTATTRTGVYARAVTTSEAITDSNTKAVSFIRSALDSLGISDVLSRSKGVVVQLLESVGITDALTKAQQLVRTITDSLGITDSTVRTAQTIRQIADTEANTTTLVKSAGFTRTISDTTGITDLLALLKIIVRSLTSQVGITDSITKIQGFGRSIAEAVGITDTITNLRNLVRSISTTEASTDVLAKAQGFVRQVLDTTGITDAVTALKILVRSIANQVGITDTTVRTEGYVRSIANTLGISDTVSRINSLVRSLTTTEGYTDALTKATSFIRQVLDSSGISDVLSYTKSGTIIVSISDALGITDSVVRVTGYRREILTSLSISDIISKSASFIRSLSTTEGMSDTMTRLEGFRRDIASSVAITDLLSHTNTLIRGIADSVGISDLVTRVSNYYRQLSSISGASDVETRSATIIRSTQDSVGITDYISVVLNIINITVLIYLTALLKLTSAIRGIKIGNTNLLGEKEQDTDISGSL